MSKPRAPRKSRTIDRSPVPAREHGGKTLRPDLAASAAIFALAFAFRLVYLFHIESIPLFYHLASDSRSYDEWAQRIAAGDWLGQGVFYQAPLYPYFLGLLQSLMGRDLWLIRVVQIILGSVSCVFLYWAGKLFFSRQVGLASGLMLSLYAPAIFFDALIQKSVLDLFLVSLLLVLLGNICRRAERFQWPMVGAVLGLLALGRENALIWLLAVPLWAWFFFAAQPWRLRISWVMFLLLGAALVLFPVSLRNLVVGGEFALTTSQLGPNFFIGNNPSSTGTYVPLRGGHADPQFERQDATELAERALGRKLSPGEVSSYWLRRSVSYLWSQPLDWLRLLGKKWLIVWNVREVEDADDFYLYQNWSWLLMALASFGHFGFLAPLAAVGILLTWREWRRLWLLYFLLATFAFSVALFYVFARYRFPMVPFLIVFAGVGLWEGYNILRQRRFALSMVCAAIFLVAGFFVRLPVVGAPRPSAAGLGNVANALSKEGKINEALESYQRALELDPKDAIIHYNLANLLADQGSLDEAKLHYLQAVKIQPDFVDAHNNLGNLFSRQGDLRRAMVYFHEALNLSSARPEIYFNLGLVLAKDGRLKEAVEHFQQAVKLKPDYAEVYYQLGLISAAQGDLERAIALFRQALQMKADFADAHASLGRALTQQGKKEEAMSHYQEAERIGRSRSGAHDSRSD